MSIIFISENSMLQNMLIKACTEGSCFSVAAYETINAIPDLPAKAVVLLHVTSSADQAALQISTLRERQPELRIALLTRERLTGSVRASLSDQTQAIIPENSSIETLLGALVVVQQGYRLSKGNTAPHSDTSMHHHSAILLDEIEGMSFAKSSDDALLSSREQAVLARLSEGGSNKDIANDLGICEATVKAHLRTCYRKIGARNRTQAAVWAVDRLSS